MFNVTSRTIILLGGPQRVDAAAPLSATVSMLVQASGTTTRVGGSAALSAEGTLAAAGDTHITFAVATPMSASVSVQGGLPIYIQAGAASLPITVNMQAAGGQVIGASVDLHQDLVLQSAGGISLGAAALSITSSATLVGSAGFILDADAEVMSASLEVYTSVNPVYRLVLPTGSSVFTSHHFFKRFPVTTGISLLIEGGVGRLTEYPSHTELRASDAFFLGGYMHQITPAERALIVSAGFGDLIQEA